MSIKQFFSIPACLSLFAGIIGVLAFAPFHLYPLMLVSLTGLLWVFIHSTPKQAFRRGFCYGLGFFGAGISWVYVSIHTFGDTPALFAVLLTAFFVAVLALFPALVGLTLNRFYPHNTSFKWWLVFPALWTLFEWVRSWAFTGFPWLLAGSSQTYWPLNSIAPIAGVYMISFVIAQMAGAIMYYRYTEACFRRNTLAYFVALLVACTALSTFHWTHAAGAPIDVSLVQGNITPSLKWQPGEADRSFQHYLNLSEGHWENRLVVWPEAAITIPLPNANDKLMQLKQLSAQHHAGLIAGIPYESINIIDDYNAAVAVGDAQGMYFKRHLVPFGEYFPMQKISKPLLYWLEIPMSNFKAGSYTQSPITYKNTQLATFICYESIFPEEVRKSASRAGLILTLSDDAWFGHSIAAVQHLQMAQMRAMETGRYVLSVTNNGITAIINPYGKIIKQLPAYQSGVLEGEISRYTGETPWLMYGSNLFLLICLGSLIIGKIREKRSASLKS
ncbi:MAG: apolipoprotein N-acyltransferase [Pseudomonadota bacterium]